jgi:DNA polymerase-1
MALPIYHPAFALRNPAFSEPIVNALAFAWALANGTATKAQPNIIWVDKITSREAMEEVTEVISKAPVLSYDIETNGREFDDPLFRIYLLAIDVTSVESREPLWTFVFGPEEKLVRMGAVLLGMTNTAKVGHNAIRFDAEALARLEPTACHALRFETDDTMLLAYLADETAQAYGLEASCHRILGLAEWKSAVTWSWHDTPAQEIDWEVAVEYCGNDARATRMLYDTLCKRVLPDTGLRRVYNDILRPAAVAFEAIERNGVYVRKDTALEVRRVFEKQRDDALTALPEGFNPNSPKQVQSLLFGHLGFTPTHFTDSGQPSTDELTVKTLKESLKDTVPAELDALLEYRNATKMISTYLNSYLEKSDEWSRVHPSYSLITTVTGRTSCFKPNYENVPRDPRIRSIIGAPPGKILLQADYSQLQLRLAAMLSGDTNMLRAFERGDDLHTLFAERLTGKPASGITKEERTTAKIANFLLTFGGEEQTFIDNAFKEYGIRFSFSQAKRIRDSFHEMWPGLSEWYGRCAKEIVDTGQIRSLAGHIRHLPGIYADDFNTKCAALREGINFTDQGLEAYICIPAVSMLVPRLPQVYGPDTFVVGFVHDAIHVECPLGTEQEVARTMKKVMEEESPAYLANIGICLSIPLVADVEAGPSWGELQKLL